MSLWCHRPTLDAVDPLLELRHYATLIAIVDTGSMAAAADRLSISQSALSHRVAEAERRLGDDLFERRPARALRPTPAGLALYQTARRVIPDLHRAESDFVRASGRSIDVVRVGVGSYDCYHWFTAFQSHLGEVLPGTLLELAVVGDAPGNRLRDATVDVVLAPGAPTGVFDSRPLFTDELVLVAHPDHPLADVPWIEPDTLADELYLTYNRTPAPGFEYDRFFRPANVEPRPMRVIEQTGAIAEMVASGVGVSILSRWALSPWIAAGKVTDVRCGELGLPLPWSALTRAGTHADSPEDRVADVLGDWLAEHA